MLRGLLGIDAVLQKLRSLSYWGLAGVGFLLLFGGLVQATFLQRKDLAVVLVFGTAFLGTAILSLALPKVLAQIIDDEQKKAQLLAQRLEAETAKRKTQEKLLDAEREIARLKRMELSLQALTPIADLSLLSVETTIMDCDRWIVSGREEPKPIVTIPTVIGDDVKVMMPGRKPKQVSYTGTISIPVKAHLGVDLQKVQVRVGGNRSLIIGGLSMTTTADTVRPTEYPLVEIRTEIYDSGKLAEIQIKPMDERLLTERDKHDHKLRERIRSGQSFTVFEKPVLQKARDALRLLLSPLDLEITFEEQVHPDSQPLFAFLAAEQKKIEQRSQELEGIIPARLPCESHQTNRLESRSV